MIPRLSHNSEIDFEISMPRCGATTRDENILLENANGVPAPSPGLRACAIPGTNQQKPPNRVAVEINGWGLPKVARRATLGFGTQSRWD